MNHEQIYEYADVEGCVTSLLLDTVIRMTVATYLENWMFQKDANHALASTLLKPELVGHTLTINSIMLHVTQGFPKLKKSELEYIVNLIRNHPPCNEEDTEPAIKIVSSFVKDCLQLKFINLRALGKLEEAEEFLQRATNFRITPEVFIDPTNIEIIKHLKIMSAPQGGKIIKSSFSLINKASIYHGYKYGDLIQVCAKPGLGKSTFLCQEGAAIADQGFNVCHMIFGDMDRFDGVIKYMSSISGDRVENVIDNVEKYVKDPNIHRIMSHVRLAAYPALSKTIHDVIAEAINLKKKFNFDVMIIDYDSNIIAPRDNMYESGGVMYSSLKGFAQGENCVVFIASQPKIANWEDEIVGMEAASESSRKQHVVDYMLTFGYNPKCKLIGTAFLPKVRRGESQVTTKVKFDYIHGRIIEISLDEYNKTLATFKAMKDSTSDVVLTNLGDPFSDTNKVVQ